VGAVRESGEGERRVALVPKVMGNFLAQGINILVEENAGQGALTSGEQNLEAGATVGDAWSADVVVKVAPPSAAEVRRLHRGSS